MARVRNDFGEVRVVPNAPFFYGEVPAGHTFSVPDEDALHWAAGGWRVLDPYPVPEHLLPNHQDGLAYALPPDEDAPVAVSAPIVPPAPTPSAATPTTPETAVADPAEPTGDEQQ